MKRERERERERSKDCLATASEFELNFKLHLRQVTSLGGSSKCDLALMAIIRVT